MTNQPPPLDAERVSDESLAELIEFYANYGDDAISCDEVAAALRELQRLRATQRESVGESVSVPRSELTRWYSWFGIQAVARSGELSAKAKAIATAMQRALSASQRKE